MYTKSYYADPEFLHLFEAGQLMYNLSLTNSSQTHEVDTPSRFENANYE